jgi:hypothetical protein
MGVLVMVEDWPGRKQFSVSICRATPRGDSPPCLAAMELPFHCFADLFIGRPGMPNLEILI